MSARRGQAASLGRGPGQPELPAESGCPQPPGLFPPAAYIKRVIAHPSFHNINFKQAEKMMETMDQGDVVIRPSSKGENHLTVTWKVCDNIYQHVDVREEGKENAFSLGATLWINTEVRGGKRAAGVGVERGTLPWGTTSSSSSRAPFPPQEFEDLDEIVARYVQPMASFARDLLGHKYYHECSGGDRKVRGGERGAGRALLLLLHKEATFDL